MKIETRNQTLDFVFCTTPFDNITFFGFLFPIFLKLEIGNQTKKL